MIHALQHTQPCNLLFVNKTNKVTYSSTNIYLENLKSIFMNSEQKQRNIAYMQIF